MTEIKILDQVLDEKYWRLTPERRHYSGHMYRNSPYETDDSCGNCDGARCDYCREVIEPEHFECGIACDELADLMVAAGCPKDDADNIATSDCSYRSGDYYLSWPQEYELEEYHPEFLAKLREEDKEIFDIMDKLYAANPKFVGCSDLFKELGVDYCDYGNPKRSHIDNQYILYRSKKRNNK